MIRVIQGKQILALQSMASASSWAWKNIFIVFATPSQTILYSSPLSTKTATTIDRNHREVYLSMGLILH